MPASEEDTERASLGDANVAEREGDASNIDGSGPAPGDGSGDLTELFAKVGAY